MPNLREPERFWIYDILLWTFSLIFDLFFREIHPRSSWKIPKSGPVIFVGAPHANQFIDPLILMRVIRQNAGRRLAFLIAEKSMKRRFIGTMARSVGAVSVGRALDSTTKAEGQVYLPDASNDPTLIKGRGTDFTTKSFQPGGLIVLPPVNNVTASAEILEIIGKEELRLKKPFSGDIAIKQLTGQDPSATGAAVVECRGTEFKVAPKVDQTQVYDQVFDKLNRDGCIGIFPEGGSHDRTELLPLKAGVAIMALGAVAQDPNCHLKIVPCGMNYFHAHKFRSRAVIEFGTPIEVPPELVDAYKNGSRRDAIGKMLAIIYDSLVAVTVTSPDYDTLMLIQAVRRLYKPKGRRLPLPMVVELNRRLVKGYTKYRDDPRIINLKKGIIKYNKDLLALNLRDHQVEYASLSSIQVVSTLLYRLTKLIVLSAGVLPGTFLFAPVFIAGKVISIRKSREALAASTVKIQARDVVATWKVLVAIALAPALYTTYTLLLAWWTYYNRIQGYIPATVPIWSIFLFGYIFFPTITYAALRFGEIGMDILKSLRPLSFALLTNNLVRLRRKREELAAEVNHLINELGPEMFPDFDAHRIVSGDVSPTPTHLNHDITGSRGEMSPSMNSHNGAKASIGSGSSYAGHLPRNESFKNLANIGLFASGPPTPSEGRTRPASRNRSRPASSGGAFGSAGYPIKSFSTLDSKEALENVSMRIRGAMQERSQRRTDGEMIDSDSDSASGISTPASELLIEEKKNL